MYNSKKAQISDTLSWIVATVIIVLLLSIPIFLVDLGAVGKREVSLYGIEGAKDVVATKSISGYLYKNYISTLKPELILQKEKISTQNLEASIYPFLLSLRRNEMEGWNLIALSGGEKIYERETFTIFRSDTKYFETPFYFYEDGKEIILDFWMGRQGG